MKDIAIWLVVIILAFFVWLTVDQAKKVVNWQCEQGIRVCR